MKRIVLLVFILLSVFTAKAQDVRFHGDTSRWYPTNDVKDKVKGLIGIPQRSFKSYYRFWTDRQVVQIWIDSNNCTHGDLINFIYRLNRKYHRKIVSEVQPLDSIKVKKIIDIYNRSQIDMIPIDAKANWEFGLDGSIDIIEHKVGNVYPYKKYWAPYVQTSTEGKAINSFFNQLHSIFDLQKSYNEFESRLFFGRYGIGMMNLWIYQNPKKAKGGSSLFN